MRQSRYSYLFLVLSLYGSLLMAAAAFYLPGNYHPMVFLLRFGTFWFCSFLLAMLVFLYYTRRQIYTLSRVDRARVMRLSTYAVSAGVVLALVVASTLFVLREAW